MNLNFSFPMLFFLAPYAFFVLIFLLYSIFNIYHLLKYGIFNTSLYAVIAVYASVTAFILGASIIYIINFDWSVPFLLPGIFGQSGNGTVPIFIPSPKL